MFARPWIYPALAFYILNLFMRLFRFHIKDASLALMRDMTVLFVRAMFCLTLQWPRGYLPSTNTLAV